MKRKSLFILLSLILLLCSACNGTVTRNIRHDGFTVGGDFICEKFYPKSKNDTTYEKIKYYSETNIITDTGKIYEVSLAQFYSNKQNCMEASTGIIVKAIFDNKIVKGIDNKYYYLISDNASLKYQEVTSGDNSYAIIDYLMRDDNVVKVVTANSNTGTYYVLKTDGNIYSIVISNNNGIQLISATTEYDKNNYDGNNIIDFNYAGDSLTTFIRTEENYYRMKIVNSEECKKYVDVTCTYSMEKDEALSKYKDRIISFNGSLLITDYKKMFSVTN